jgi:hypothetical protein
MTDGMPMNEGKNDGNGEEGNMILAHITKQKAVTSPHDIRNILASAHKRSETNNHFQGGTHGKSGEKAKNLVFIDGKRYIQANNHKLHYNIANHEKRDTKIASLIDRGANGGLAREDVRIIEQSERTADVSGIKDHTIRGLSIVTAAGVVTTHLGPICVIMHQYAYHGKGKTIHSSVQIENHGNDVNDKSLKVKGGKQCITTLDGYAIPLQIRGGLAYMDMYPPSDDELNDLPYVVLTSDIDWDPTIVDNEIDIEEWLDAQMELDFLPGVNDYADLTFDDQGYYRNISANNTEFVDASQDISGICELDDIVENLEYRLRVENHNVSSNDPDFAILRPNFAWAPLDIIKKTFDVTTRWARSPKHRASPIPKALQVPLSGLKCPPQK